MRYPPIFSRLLVTLVFAGILLPITLCVVLGVAALLVQMGDTSGGGVLQRIALAGGILWAVDLICLVLIVAIGLIGWPGGPDETS
jgi:hypothetical protein